MDDLRKAAQDVVDWIETYSADCLPQAKFERLRAALAQPESDDFNRGFQRGWERATKDRDRDAAVRIAVEAKLAEKIVSLAQLEPATAEDMAVYDAIANNYHNSVTDTMIDAYLIANDTYWRETDLIAPPPGKWRTGTVREATRVSLLAALISRKPESYIEEDAV